MSKTNAKRAPAVEVAPITTNAPVLTSFAPLACRAGTARHAAYLAIAECMEAGATRAQCLEAVKAAEMAWHAENGRVVKAVASAGWLKLFACEFGQGAA
jgi:uncharacterized protein YgiB involved in biofilm formation